MSKGSRSFLNTKENIVSKYFDYLLWSTEGSDIVVFLKAYNPEEAPNHPSLIVLVNNIGQYHVTTWEWVSGRTERNQLCFLSLSRCYELGANLYGSRGERREHLAYCPGTQRARLEN